MANLITVARLILLFVTIWLIYVGNVQVITACIFVLLFIFLSDGLDGWVARRRNTTSDFGAVFDIASDRIVENALWVVFAEMGLIPVWIPLLVLSRSFIVDGLRSLSYSEGKTAFGKNNMMRSPLTQWLTAGRFMRAVCGLQAYEHHDASGTVLGKVYDVDAFRWIGWGLVYLAVVLTVVRALPVIFDAMALYGPDAQKKQREAVNS